MNNILETYQFDDVNVGEVFPYTERKTLYGHLKPGDKVKFFEITTLDEFDQINHLDGKNFKK